VFRKCGAQAQCARCVCNMRKMISEQDEVLRYAAE
jgi:bacterioferritin-associated ferredoxin